MVGADFPCTRFLGNFLLHVVYGVHSYWYSIIPDVGTLKTLAGMLKESITSLIQFRDTQLKTSYRTVFVTSLKHHLLLLFAVLVVLVIFIVGKSDVISATHILFFDETVLPYIKLCHPSWPRLPK